MIKYSFFLNCGNAFEYESPVLQNIKGIFAGKKKQKMKDEMIEKAKNIFKKYGIEMGTSAFGSRLTLEADSSEAADSKVGEAVDELKKWYNKEFNQEQTFSYTESRF